MGSLFVNRFKRIHVDSEKYLKRLIIYVHHNPKSAGLVSNTNLVSKYAINKLEYNFLLEDKNYLHSRSYGNNF